MQITTSLNLKKYFHLNIWKQTNSSPASIKILEFTLRGGVESDKNEKIKSKSKMVFSHPETHQIKAYIYSIFDNLNDK